MVRFCVVFFVMVSGALYAQELPPIKNYEPLDYDGENQNWSISQTDDGNIYVANNNSLLEFNGEKWLKYPSPNGTVIRSVHADGDRVYMGSYMDFGYWQQDEFGILQYTSLLPFLEKPLASDEQFWNIGTVENWVLFQSLTQIYIYDSVDKKFQVVGASNEKAQLFNLSSGVYFQQMGKGVFKIDNAGATLVTDDPIVRQNLLVGLFEHQGKQLILTEDATFYQLAPDGLKVWQIPAQDVLKGISLYSSQQLQDGSFALGSISSGMFHLNTDGELINRINKRNGIINNTVLSIFQDADANLWLGLDSGISVVNLETPFQEYIDKAGSLGVVYTGINFGDRLYLGTNQGLFWRKLGSDAPFELVKGTVGQVWSLKNLDGVLFCGHNKGTFLVQDNGALLISDIPGTWNIKKIPQRDNLILQGHYTGLSILKKISGSWQLEGKLSGFDISSRFFEFLDDDILAVNHEYKGVYILELDTAKVTAKILKEQPQYGYGSSLVKFRDEVKYITNAGMFAIDSNSFEATYDSILSRVAFTDSIRPASIMIPDGNEDRLWCFTTSGILNLQAGRFNSKVVANHIATPSFLQNSLGVLGFENLNYLYGNTYLIGISNGYVTLDLDKVNPQKKNQIKINSITRDYFNEPTTVIPLEQSGVFENSDNNIRFQYSVPQYDKFVDVQYQYRLLGKYDNWSGWSGECSVSFTNLPHGEYEFQVRAKVGNGLSDNVAAYGFEVLKPWHLGIVALMTYIIGFVLLILLIHRLYLTYYNQQQEKLIKENKLRLKRKRIKAKKKIVQLKNEKLKNEIDGKNRELAVATMSIIKKNEFLATIKNQLDGIDNMGQIKAVIKTIDRNIDNADDWKFFEEAFNNADKNFLGKVKTLHPEMTPNDLKLCAYLRLNLSSKEIAPLLNISVRSVEVKRYRLRKKMDLPHESSLTEYIMSI